MGTATRFRRAISDGGRLVVRNRRQSPFCLVGPVLIDSVPKRNYNVIMKVSVVQIGNSRGVRIPKAVLEQVGLRDEAEMEVRGSELIIRSANHPRAGWEAAFAKMAERGDDALLDAPTSTKWDETEWR